MRPLDSVTGTRWTRWTPRSNFSRLHAPRPWTKKMMSLRPPTPVGLERSEEHTSELQSPCNLVCRLLLEKKKEDVCEIDGRPTPRVAAELASRREFDSAAIVTADTCCYLRGQDPYDSILIASAVMMLSRA